MPIPLLPGLKEEAKIAISKRGEWVSTSQNTLPNLVDSLKVAASYDSKISSIPDVWARPILFKSILLDKQHALYRTCVNEWRGLVAMLALRKLRGLEGLSILSVNIPESNKVNADDPEFLKVLSRSLPLEYREEAKDETAKSGYKIQLLMYGDDPIGMFWPKILICPSVELDKYRRKEVAWWRADGIDDPISELSVDEKNMLYVWLENLKEKISDRLSMELIKDFVSDLGNSLGDSLKEDTTVTQSMGQSLGVTGICACIDIPIAPTVDNSFIDKSHVLLKNQRQSNAKKILIVSPDLEALWNVNASDIILGGYITVGSMLGQMQNIIDNPTKAGEVDLTEFAAEVRLSTSFFTDGLAMIYKGNNAFPNNLYSRVYEFKGVRVNFLLPVKEELLRYLEPDYIASHIQFNVMGNEVEVSLSIPVSGYGSNKEILAKRRYSMDGDAIASKQAFPILEYDNIPVVQVWPNFILSDSEKWKRYYTFFDSRDDITFHAKPFWKELDMRYMGRIRMDAELRTGEQFPEAFACSEPGRDNAGDRQFGLDINDKKGMEIGLLLLKQPEKKILSSTNKKWRVGIDFGTTNTVAYRSINGDNFELIHLENYMFPVCYDDEGDISPAFKKALRQNFFSPWRQPDGANATKTASTSIKTMFHTHTGRFDGDINQPLFKGNIYFLDNVDNISNDTDILEGIHTDDMKWGEAEGKENMQGFLLQLCMQCAAEAINDGATSIEWSYSYPTAFSKRRIREFTKAWAVVINKIREFTGNVDMSSPMKETESDCIAKYFVRSMRASINTGIVCFDIGGGSTDIAIWQGKDSKMQNQTSLRLAGRHMFNDYLWNRKQAGEFPLRGLKTFNELFNTQLDSLAFQSERQRFNMQLEVFLKYFESDIFGSLNVKATDPAIETMIRDITFVLSGIFYYAGILIGHLRREGIYTENDILPHCYVGGNASKLLDWAAEGNFTKDEMVADVFKASFIEGLKFIQEDLRSTKGFGLEKTKNPKQEVAYGLVCDKDIVDTDSDLDDNLVAGEAFYVNGELHSPGEFITADDIVSGVEISKDNPEMFIAFVDRFNREMKEFGYETLSLEEDDFIRICSNVNQRLADIAKKANQDPDEVEVEPLFIILLKEAFTYIASR